MNIRNVQKTGNMFYVYLPTEWCKKYNINSKSKVFVESKNDGTLVIDREEHVPEKKSFELKVSENNSEVLHKLIVASYINPLSSFRIILDNKLDAGKILDQKKLISIESVEVDGKSISCESSITVNDPFGILKTMVNKIKNLIVILKNNYNKELIERYEEEIDRSKLLIDKAVIAYFTNHLNLKHKPIQLYYISNIVKDLERLVDHLILVDTKDSVFLEEIYGLVISLKKVIDDPNALNTENIIKFIKQILKIKECDVKNVQSYRKTTIRQYFIKVSEVLLDYSITNKIE